MEQLTKNWGKVGENTFLIENLFYGICGDSNDCYLLYWFIQLRHYFIMCYKVVYPNSSLNFDIVIADIFNIKKYLQAKFISH